MSFDIAKSSLLDKLTAGVDFSPKGSIDAPVIELVDFINDLPDYVTTSSCSGRISVFRDENSTKGIQWILVVHGVITVQQLKDAITTQDIVTAGSHFIVLKCEAFILHVRCRDLESGRKLHHIAMGCGFRESGLSMGQKRVQLAIRTTAYGLELPLAIGTKILLDDFALDVIVSEANRRLRKNFARTDRLLTALKKEYIWPSMMQMNTSPFSNVHRWGHSYCSDTKGSCMIIGMIMIIIVYMYTSTYQLS
jgi:tRNA wybutosine-synthesizing protein 3